MKRHPLHSQRRKQLLLRTRSAIKVMSPPAAIITKIKVPNKSPPFPPATPNVDSNHHHYDTAAGVCVPPSLSFLNEETPRSEDLANTLPWIRANMDII